MDGNKRTSLAVMNTFLILNGYDITADDLELLKVWLSLADGSMSESECAQWLRAMLRLSRDLTTERCQRQKTVPIEID
jgi:death on curing protein